MLAFPLQDNTETESYKLGLFGEESGLVSDSGPILTEVQIADWLGQADRGGLIR